MTTPTSDTAMPAHEEHPEYPWELIDEYRVGDIFIRVRSRDTGNEDPDFEYILANTAAGLDQPDAFRVGNTRHLHDALRLAGEMCFLSMSASMSEERAFNREFVRCGAVSIHEEPPPWIDAPEPCHEAETPAAVEQAAEKSSPFVQDFAYRGLYGRVVSEYPRDPDSFRVTLARNQFDLGTHRELPIGSHATAYGALWAAGMIIDIADEISSRTALGYRELARSGVTLLKPYEQDR